MIAAPAPRRRCTGDTLLAAIVSMLATVLLSCGGEPAVCTETRLSDSASTALPAASARIDFTPQLPCTFGSSFLVTNVFVDELPGTPPQPRIHFAVTRHDETAFLLSETRALDAFSQIPLSTHRVRFTVGSVRVDGFAGPSGNDQDIAYLQWRVGDVTYELQATLYAWLSEQDVRALATALIEGG